MEDKYLYFSFDEVHSSVYNCFYSNNGEDKNFPMFPVFNDSTETPLFQKRSYYLGTSKDNKDFPFNCVCEKVTLNQFRQLQKWLSAEKIANLSLDFVPNYHWKVKIKSFSIVSLFPLDERKTTFHCTFTLTFRTLDDAAISDILFNFPLEDYRFTPTEDEPVSNILDPDYRIPVIDYEPTVLDKKVADTVGLKTIRLFNPQSYEYFLNNTYYNIQNLVLYLYNDKYYYTLVNNIKTSKKWIEYKLSNYLGSSTLTLNQDSLLNYLVDKERNRTVEDIFSEQLGGNDTPFLNEGGFSIPSSEIHQEEMELVNVSNVTISNKDNTKTKEGIRLTFSVDSSSVLNNFNYGTSIEEDGNERIIENENGKVIFVQSLGFDDYLLYNEDGYNTGFYYVNKQYTFLSYTFDTNTNQLVVVLLNLDNAKNNFTTYFNERINKKFLISIGDYTQLDIINVSSNGEGTTEINFNLRTIF